MSANNQLIIDKIFKNDGLFYHMRLETKRYCKLKSNAYSEALQYRQDLLPITHHHKRTEFIWFGTRHSLAKLPTECRSLTVCSSVIQCTDVVRDLGVLLDSELSMQSHICKVTSACFYNLRRLRQIQNYVTQEVMAQFDYILQFCARWPSCIYPGASATCT